MRKSEQLERIIEHYAGGNKSKMARLLGVSPQAISTWIAREAYDIELIYAKCENINPEWLLTGKGPMLKSNNTSYTLPDNNMSMVAESSSDYIQSNPYYIMYKEKDKEVRALSEELGALKERIRQLEADRLNDQNQDAEIASTKKLHSSKKDVTSANVHSK